MFHLLLPLLLLSSSRADWPDPHHRTSGEIWPRPQSIQYTGVIDVDVRQFKIVHGSDCDVVKMAAERYEKLIKNMAGGESEPSSIVSNQFTLSLVTKACPHLPSLGMDESYKLTVEQNGAVLTANECWGILRGLETYSQLIYHDAKGAKLRLATVRDYPRFPHRGLLLDTARHYFDVDVIKAILSLMSMNKFNVFHWHIVDNEAFPYKSEVYPDLAKGAYSPKHVYTIPQIKDLIEFARVRGIRVIPELDTPGHAKSWGVGIEELTNRCFDEKYTETFDRAMLDLTRPATWDVLSALFKEVFHVFPDQYAHLGGDEAEYWLENCWMRNKNVTNYMKYWSLKSALDLEQHYFDRLLMHLRERDMPHKKFMVWQEVLDVGVELPSSVIGHVWKGNTNLEQMNEVKKVVQSGHMAVLSSCWYLDHISWNIDYLDYLACDPQGFDGTAAEKSMVLGGEAAMWAEMVDASQVIPRIFPRASATAEALWSSKRDRAEGKSSWPRLYEWQCRMSSRGYPVQPGYGPGYCPHEYRPRLPEE